MPPESPQASQPAAGIPFPRQVICPHCQASNSAVDSACASCRRALTVYIAEPTSAGSFRLSTIMSLIAVLCILMALMRADGFLGVVAVALATPALIRTLLVARRERAWGMPLSYTDCVFVFVASGFAVALIILASSLLFALVYAVFPFGSGGKAELSRMTFSGLAALILAGWLGKKMLGLKVDR